MSQTHRLWAQEACSCALQAHASRINLLAACNPEGERMRTATRSHLLPHASPDPPHYVDLAYFVSQESFAVDPRSPCQNYASLCLNLANNSSSKLLPGPVDPRGCPPRGPRAARTICQPSTERGVRGAPPRPKKKNRRILLTRAACLAYSRGA